MTTEMEEEFLDGESGVPLEQHLDENELEEISNLVLQGHTDHCAKRIVWGDGECECNFGKQLKEKIFEPEHLEKGKLSGKEAIQKAGMFMSVLGMHMPEVGLLFREARPKTSEMDFEYVGGEHPYVNVSPKELEDGTETGVSCPSWEPKEESEN